MEARRHCEKNTGTGRRRKRGQGPQSAAPGGHRLLLPGSLLVAMLTELLATFVLVDFRFAAFFQ
jgi:hypothetical protein